MAIDAIVRVSFQSSVGANHSANNALVGDPQDRVGNRPFEKVGTAVYTCSEADAFEVARCMADLGDTLADHAGDIDFVSVSLAQHEN